MSDGKDAGFPKVRRGFLGGWPPLTAGARLAGLLLVSLAALTARTPAENSQLIPLRGIVLTDKPVCPVPDAIVQLSYRINSKVSTIATQTDRNGKFTLRVAAGSYSLRVLVGNVPAFAGVVRVEEPRSLSITVPSSAQSRSSSCDSLSPAGEVGELVRLANEVRSAAKLRPLLWDGSLAAAARGHVERMAAAVTISHRYAGEADWTERAASAGARFSLVEENIAVGSSADQIHDGWMHSEGHRENLLNADVDRIGVALLRAHGRLYAVADYSKFVPPLTVEQVESNVGNLMKAQGLSVLGDALAARQYCSREAGGLSASNQAGGERARFGMRWQASAITSLPQQLAQKIAGGGFHAAAVGACAPEGSKAGTSFSSYRVGVLLY